MEMEELLGSRLLPAIIAALVAILVFFLSQYFLARRNSVELKTTKLEELYLVLNELANEHTTRIGRITTIVNGDRTYLDDPEHVVKLYLHDHNKKILMYVRLFFPALISAYREMYQVNKEVTKNIKELIYEGKGDQQKTLDIFKRFSATIKRLEAEIVYNKKTLVGENIRPVRHFKMSGFELPEQEQKYFNLF
ncbi:hypothetical protein [Microbulbifer sp. ZKSA002]|uniref:hypothetical protein n=1 Tax=Microbulbifer sp. ZKSA002 TaxID=3243388 RepID=UPI004039B3FC